MNNIEEVIKVIHKIISFYKDLDTIHATDTCSEIKALENILAERKQDKARIKELEEALLKVKDKNVKLFIHYKNSIPKQKIKNKVEELKDLAKRIAGTYQYADSGDDLIEKKNKVIELRTKAEALEELLQEIEDKNAN